MSVSVYQLRHPILGVYDHTTRMPLDSETIVSNPVLDPPFTCVVTENLPSGMASLTSPSGLQVTL